MAPRVDDDPFDQTAARREWAREVRRADRDYDAAYQLGRDDATADAAADAADVPPAAPAAPSSTPRPRSSSSSSSELPGAHLSSLLLTAIGWALALAFVREGPAGPKRWVLAKFANRTT